jgi:hypothetical protein
MEEFVHLIYKTLTSLFTVLSMVLYTGMVSRAWLWVIDLFGFCETEGQVIKRKGLQKGKEKGLEGGNGEVKVVRNRRVEDIKREQSVGVRKRIVVRRRWRRRKRERRRSGGRVGLRFKLRRRGWGDECEGLRGEGERR